MILTDSTDSPEKDSRDPHRVVLSKIRRLFNDADANGDQELNEDELSGLMQKLWKETHGKSMPGDIRLRSVEQVRKSMSRFDCDGNGKLNFDEFLRLVQVEPWKAMLPEDVREILPFVLMKRVNYQAQSTSEKAATTAAEFTEMLKGLFDQIDNDSSGFIDESELIVLIRRLESERR